MRVRYSTHHAREPLGLQCGTIASNTYHYTSIDKLRHHFVYTSSCRETELKTSAVFMFYDVKLRVNSCERKHVAKFLLPRTAGWHRNGLGLFSMEIIAYIGRPFSVSVDGFVSHFALGYYSCTATTLYLLSFSKHRGRIK